MSILLIEFGITRVITLGILRQPIRSVIRGVEESIRTVVWLRFDLTVQGDVCYFIRARVVLGLKDSSTNRCSAQWARCRCSWDYSLLWSSLSEGESTHVLSHPEILQNPQNLQQTKDSGICYHKQLMRVKPKIRSRPVTFLSRAYWWLGRCLSVL